MSKINILASASGELIAIEAENSTSRVELGLIESISRLDANTVGINDEETEKKLEASREVYVYLSDGRGYKVLADTVTEAKEVYRLLLELWYTNLGMTKAKLAANDGSSATA